MTLRKPLLLLMLVCSMSLCAVNVAVAQGSDPGVPASQPDARAALARMGDFLAQAKQFSVSINIGFDVLQETGQKIEFGESRKVTLARPDRFRVEVERGDGEKALMLFDGREITVFSPQEKVYARVAVAGDVDRALFYLLNDLKLRLPLAMMFVSNLPSELERRVLSVEMVEKATIMDVECAHLAARTDQVDFQIWIPLQGDPLPRRVIITYKNAAGQPQFWANLSEWNLSPKLAEDFCTFTPSEGIQQIPFLAQLEVAKPKVMKVKKGGKK